MRHSDIALMLDAVAALISNSCRLKLVMPSPVIPDADLENLDPVVPAAALELYEGVYRLLLSLLRSRKELLVDIIPCFTTVLKDLLLVCWWMPSPLFLLL